MSFLAIDPGSRRHGAAVSDELGICARPMPVIPAQHEHEALAAIVRLASDWAATRIIVGLPLNMDGTEGPSAKAARTLGEKVQAATGVEVVFWDERLTTDEAERALRDEGRSFRQRKQMVDSRSAQIILQSYLDAKGKESGGGSQEP
jgi:putative holliday junction resolvase